MKKIISLILALTLLMGLGITAFAAETTTRQAELYYREVKILVDGKELIPQDVNGESTEPFIIDGTTYLPIRAVAGALGLEVKWDGEQNRIYLTTGGDINYGSGESVGTQRVVSATLGYRGVRLYLNGLPLNLYDANGKKVDPFIMGDTTYVPVRAIADGLGLSVDWNGAHNTVILDSGKGYFPSRVTRSITGRHGSVTETIEYTYSAEGAPISVKYRSDDGESYTASIKYDDAMRITRFAVTGSRNFGFERKFDKSGLMTYEKQWQGSNYTERSLSYNEAGLLITETVTERSSSGTVKTTVTYTYDKSARLVKEVSKTGSAETVTEYSYNAKGDLTLVKTTEGKNSFKTEYKYDAKGNLLGVYTYENNWLTGKTEHSYDALGRVTSTTTANAKFEKTTSFVYDSKGNVVQEIYSDSDGVERVTDTQYDRYGNPCAATVEEQGENIGGEYVFTEDYEYEYSPDGLLLWRSRSDSRGDTSSYRASYDALGRTLFTETSVGGAVSSSFLAQFELGPWPVYQANNSLSGGSTVIEAEYKTFDSNKYQEILEYINSLLTQE